MATEVLYTTIEAIRSSLGLDEADVEDNLILNSSLRSLFILDLKSWYGTDFPTDWTSSGYSAITPTTDVPSSPSDVEELGMALSNYSTWFGADLLITTLLAIPKKISDGSDYIERFGNIDLKEMQKTVADKKLEHKRLLAKVKGITLYTGQQTSTEVLGANVVGNTAQDAVTGTT